MSSSFKNLPVVDNHLEAEIFRIIKNEVDRNTATVGARVELYSDPTFNILYTRVSLSYIGSIIKVCRIFNLQDVRKFECPNSIRLIAKHMIEDLAKGMADKSNPSFG